jgi:hypothetical protein
VSISRRPVRPQGTKPSDPEEAAVLSVSSYPQEHIDACRAWAEQAGAALRPATSVLGLEPGQEVAVDADGFLAAVQRAYV